MIGKSMARGDDESTPSAGAEAEGRSVGTRGWFIISECHWLTIIGELRSLWFIIIFNLRRAKMSFSSTIYSLQYFLRQSATWRLQKPKQKVDIWQTTWKIKFNGLVLAKWLKTSRSRFHIKGGPSLQTQVSHWSRRHFNQRKDETIGKLIDHILKKDN